MFKHTLIILLALHAMGAGADDLIPFSSDGCSAFPDGTLQRKQLWLSCCIAHDLAYWKGGTYQDRLDADLALKQCVAELGEPTIGAWMLVGVRLGGSPYYPTGFRWGYGWPFPRYYGPLSADEHRQADRLTPPWARSPQPSSEPPTKPESRRVVSTQQQQ